MSLKAWRNKKQGLMLSYPPCPNGQTKPDARFLSSILSEEVIKELTQRGYDITTLRFSIKPDPNHPKFKE